MYWQATFLDLGFFKLHLKRKAERSPVHVLRDTAELNYSSKFCGEVWSFVKLQKNPGEAPAAQGCPGQWVPGQPHRELTTDTSGWSNVPYVKAVPPETKDKNL